MTTKVHLLPSYRGADKADGGIRRVVEAQQRWLPQMGIELVGSIAEADVVATHALEHPKVPVGTPWVSHCHGMYYSDFGWHGAWYQKANRHLVEILRSADHVTAPSDWVAQTLRRGMWMNPTVLPHGVNPEEWTGGHNEGYVLWNKARSDAASDPAPVNELARLMPSVKFVSTFGDAVPNVRITGAVPYEEGREIIKNAAVYLCTTRETFGIGTLEAMAAGVPVVGWAWGGQRDIIRHKETGWLCAPGDFDGLEEGIRWALRTRDSSGDEARADVLERWTWERAMHRYADLYRSLAAEAVERSAGPKVSVIVPCFNLGQFVGETLKSVQAQIMTDWECIVVDDASTDDSAAVVSEFTNTDERITYLRNPRNLHVSETRNRGTSASKGRYVVCIDADDMMTPETLTLLSDALDEDRSIHLAYGGLQVMSEAGVLRDHAHEWPVPFDFKEQIQGRNQVPTLCMFRRSVFERTGGYRRRISPVEDADLWTRAASIGFVPKMVTEAATLLYRLRANSLSRTMKNPEWVHWYPWSRQRSLLPFAAAVEAPASIGAWPVPTFEPAKIAVIIPVGKGHEGLLVDALDSVEAQTFRNWECYVINDTGAPLKWTPPWATVIDTPLAGSGPALARNLGIFESKAPLFLPLDADDYLQPDALQVLYETWQETGGVVYSSWWDEYGKERKVYNPPAYDARLLTQKGCIHAVTALYPKQAWVDVGGFDEQMTHWEDWDFQLALASKGVCGHWVDVPLWNYRKHTGERRENNQKLFEQGKAAILRKWGRFWEGKETLMACSSCGGGRSGRHSAGSNQNNGGGGAGDASAPAGAVLLEFQGQSPSVVMYRGKGTGQQYRFGNTDEHRRKFVLGADVAHLLSLRGIFKVIEGPATPPQAGASPVLEAPAPAFVELPEPVFAEAVAAPVASAEAAEVRGVGALLAKGYKDIRDVVPSLTVDELKAALETERLSEAPRSSVTKLLEKALETMAVPA